MQGFIRIFLTLKVKMIAFISRSNTILELSGLEYLVLDSVKLTSTKILLSWYSLLLMLANFVAILKYDRKNNNVLGGSGDPYIISISNIIRIKKVGLRLSDGFYQAFCGSQGHESHHQPQQ